MDTPRAIYDRFQASATAHTEVCVVDPLRWHRADVKEFEELKRLLLPHAESGDALCQYALATILWLGWCCDSEDQFQSGQAEAVEEATPWWIAAARQGYWPALDNLVCMGIGLEAERAKKGWSQLEAARPDLIGASHGMPVYGPEFVMELSRRLYGTADSDTLPPAVASWARSSFEKSPCKPKSARQP